MIDERPTYLSDALPEGQAAALAFGLAGIVFFFPLSITTICGGFSEPLVWVLAVFALATFIVAWIAMTRREDKRTWPRTSRPADWERGEE